MNKVRVSAQGRRAVKRAALPHLVDSAQRIADAANRESSWAAPEGSGLKGSPGGYVAREGKSVAVVIALSPGASRDNARTQRLLRLANRGRV